MSPTTELNSSAWVWVFLIKLWKERGSEAQRSSRRRSGSICLGPGQRSPSNVVVEKQNCWGCVGPLPMEGKSTLIISMQQDYNGEPGDGVTNGSDGKGGKEICIQVGCASVGWMKAVEKSNNRCSNRYTSEAGSIHPEFWFLGLTHLSNVSGRLP